MKLFHLLAASVCVLFYVTLPLLISGCSSDTPIQEATYTDGFQTQSAEVEAVPGGGYRTVSGDPLVAVNGDIEQTSMLPYGGGDEGIRTMEDETPFYSTN